MKPGPKTSNRPQSTISRQWWIEKNLDKDMMLFVLYRWILNQRYFLFPGFCISSLPPEINLIAINDKPRMISKRVHTHYSLVHVFRLVGASSPYSLSSSLLSSCSFVRIQIHPPGSTIIFHISCRSMLYILSHSVELKTINFRWCKGIPP